MTIHGRRTVWVSLKARVDDDLELHASGIPARIRKAAFVKPGLIRRDTIAIAASAEDGRRIVIQCEVEPPKLNTADVICIDIDTQRQRLLKLFHDCRRVLVVTVKRQRSIRRSHLQIVLNNIEESDTIIAVRILHHAFIANRMLRVSAHSQSADRRIRTDDCTCSCTGSILLRAVNRGPRRVIEASDIPAVLGPRQITAAHDCAQLNLFGCICVKIYKVLSAVCRLFGAFRVHSQTAADFQFKRCAVRVSKCVRDLADISAGFGRLQIQIFGRRAADLAAHQ